MEDLIYGNHKQLRGGKWYAALQDQEPIETIKRQKNVRRYGLGTDDPELQKLTVLIPNHSMVTQHVIVTSNKGNNAISIRDYVHLLVTLHKYYEDLGLYRYRPPNIQQTKYKTKLLNNQRWKRNRYTIAYVFWQCVLMSCVVFIFLQYMIAQ